MAAKKAKAERAIRARVSGDVRGVGLREAVLARARELGVWGWARHGEQDDVLVHAEGNRADVESLIGFLREGPAGAGFDAVEIEEVKPEGHEQFAIRGVSAGAFLVVERSGDAPSFELRLEVDGAMCSWALPKGPSMDPAVKRMAIALPDRLVETADPAEADRGGGLHPWDSGNYEQGGRVAWPEAIERGHAVFVLHGERLRGGFALQRTRGGDSPQWLLIKRRDEQARPGSDVVAEAGGER